MSYYTSALSIPASRCAVCAPYSCNGHVRFEDHRPYRTSCWKVPNLCNEITLSASAARGHTRQTFSAAWHCCCGRHCREGHWSSRRSLCSPAILLGADRSPSQQAAAARHCSAVQLTAPEAADYNPAQTAEQTAAVERTGGTALATRHVPVPAWAGWLPRFRSGCHQRHCSWQICRCEICCCWICYC